MILPQTQIRLLMSPVSLDYQFTTKNKQMQTRIKHCQLISLMHGEINVQHIISD
jgi:hypothetical protein